MFKKYRDIISGSILLLLASIIFIESFSIKKLDISSLSAQFVPQLASILLALIALFIIYGGFKQLKKLKSVSITEDDVSKKEGSKNIFGIATFALITLYVSLLDTLGFIIMTSIYLFFQFIILAEKEDRKLPIFAVVSVVVSVSIYYIFLLAFQLSLPAGILG
ncbi:MAG: tripartite tricarboxylate transporter TctB family protein [Clostridia bacterium]